MAVIEVTTFRPAAGIDDQAVLAGDRDAHLASLTGRPRALRRTTARADDGAWLVLTLWASADDAEAASSRDGGALAAPLAALADPASVTTRRFTTLD